MFSLSAIFITGYGVPYNLNVFVFVADEPANHPGPVSTVTVTDPVVSTNEHVKSPFVNGDVISGVYEVAVA